MLCVEKGGLYCNNLNASQAAEFVDQRPREVCCSPDTSLAEAYVFISPLKDMSSCNTAKWLGLIGTIA